MKNKLISEIDPTKEYTIGSLCKLGVFNGNGRPSYQDCQAKVMLDILTDNTLKVKHVKKKIRHFYYIKGANVIKYLNKK